MFRHFKSQLKELYVFLAYGEEHEKVFHELPIVGLKKNKNLKNYIW